MRNILSVNNTLNKANVLIFSKIFFDSTFKCWLFI